MTAAGAPVAARRRSGRLGAAPVVGLLLIAAVGIAGCGGNERGAAPSDASPAEGAARTSPAPDGATPTPMGVSPAEDGGSAAADAPSPAGVRPDPSSRTGRRPRSLSERVAADATAKLNVRTMVSVIEGCHSGRDTYKACNTHAELGSEKLLGLRIGKRRGEVQISATDNGFRITGHSMSGAKFTAARGPSGDRFKCLAGPMPGACPPDRTWAW